MVRLFRVHRDLRRGADRDLVAGQIFLDVDESQGSTVRLRAIIRKRSRCLHLTCRNRIQDETHLAFEHPAGHRIKGNLRLVTGIDPLLRTGQSLGGAFCFHAKGQSDLMIPEPRSENPT
jgi:hypothetical protein